MDADGSHAPEQLHRLLDADRRRRRSGDRVALRRRRRGAQLAAGGGWCCPRTANGYSRILLGVDIHDITAGYRAYRREVLEKIDLAAVDSKGYWFQVDLTWRAINAGFIVVEVPITFAERELGVSKMERVDHQGGDLQGRPMGSRALDRASTRARGSAR